MTLQQKIDEAANNWNKTKDPKYKKLWYKLIHGYYSSKRRTLPSDTNNKRYILDGMVLTDEIDCLDLCDIIRLKLSGYVDTLNLHVMNDNSGYFIGCMCR